jgi:hypothetical protein
VNEPHDARTRRGIALFTALSVLVLLGALLAAAVASMTLAGRSARLAELDARLDANAEYVLNTVFSEPEKFGIAESPYGRAQTFDVTIPNAPDVASTVTVTRLRGGLIWIVAEARLTTADGAVRRASGIARWRGPTQLPQVPLIARGTIALDASVTFDADTSSDPDCAASSGAVTHSMQSSDSSAYYLLPAQRALLDSAPNVLRFARDTSVGPGEINGVVLADGALTLVAPLRVHGLIVARGSITASTGVSIEGALMSFDSTAEKSITLNGVSVRYSPCAIAQVFRRLHPPQRLHARTWLEVF